MSDVCLTSVAYIGPKSRTERLRKTKIGTEVGHVRRDSDTTFNNKLHHTTLQVLEFAEGGDALHYVQSAGALGEDRARTWSMQVTSAVTYMHDLGIAHRDLKLENLLLTGDLRTIKICDFGFVRQKTVRCRRYWLQLPDSIPIRRDSTAVRLLLDVDSKPNFSQTIGGLTRFMAAFRLG